MAERCDVASHSSDNVYNDLRADCEQCFGLCCVALFFSAAEGFPVDKKAGQVCLNPEPDFRCSVHDRLGDQGLKGCLAFDCFGAGQKVSMVSFGGKDWRKLPETAEQMFKVFLVVRQLQELLWYLTEALALEPAALIHHDLSLMLEKTEKLTRLSPDALLELDVAAHRAAVNTLLLKTSELVRDKVHSGEKPQAGRRKAFGRGADLMGADLRKRDLRGTNLRSACLIAADLRGNDLQGTDFIGADFRDADIRDADLSGSFFLTQSQVNAAKGDYSTRLPVSLRHPAHWEQGNHHKDGGNG